MNTILYAQPYDISATGFYFETGEDYAKKARSLRNAHGEHVEEFEIQFIDGEAINAAFAEAVGLHQGQLAAFFEAVETWHVHQKLGVIIAVWECGYSFDLAEDGTGDFDLDIYEGMTLRDLAEQFVEEGLFGEIPERLAFYLDFDAIARDLSADYTETEIAGIRLTYRCA